MLRMQKRLAAAEAESYVLGAAAEARSQELSAYDH